jgi:hypothetical protein
MASGDIKLGVLGSEAMLSPGGRTFTEGRLELAREDRTASGKLVKEIIAVKKTFKLDYELIDGDDLAAIITLYNLQSELSLLVYEEGSVLSSYTIRMKPFDRTRILAIGIGLWGNVTFEMEQV